MMVSRLAEAIASMLLANTRPPRQSLLTINSGAVPKVASDSIAPACRSRRLARLPFGLDQRPFHIRDIACVSLSLPLILATSGL